MQNLTYFSRNHRADQFAFSRGYFLGLITNDKEEYEKYQAGCLDDFDEKKLLEMEVIGVLDKLNFPLCEVGTYLFKDMIVKAIHELDGYDYFGNLLTEDALLMQMRQPFSQFYVDIARNELDMGIKTFHTYIERMLEDVNYKNMDISILCEIYGNSFKDTDYGEHAFLIAKYMKHRQKEMNPQFKKTYLTTVCLTTLPRE